MKTLATIFAIAVMAMTASASQAGIIAERNFETFDECQNYVSKYEDVVLPLWVVFDHPNELRVWSFNDQDITTSVGCHRENGKVVFRIVG